MSAGDARLYSDTLGNRVAHDGVSPVSWRLSSYVVAVRDGAILLVEPVWAERWELPGGEVELDESLLDGAIRECREETGHRFVPPVRARRYAASRAGGRICQSSPSASSDPSAPITNAVV